MVKLVPPAIIKHQDFKLIAASDLGRAAEFAEIVQRNQQHFKFLPHTSQITTVSKAKAEINGYALKRRKRTMFFYFIIDKSNKLVGCAGVKIKDPHHVAEGCYWLDNRQCGKGYATNAVSLLEKAMFALHYRRFEIWCNADNLSSVKIPQRLGYNREGVLLDAEYLGGSYHNVLIFSKLTSNK